MRQLTIILIAIICLGMITGCGPSLEKLGQTVTVKNPDGTETITESTVASIERSANEAEGKCWEAEKASSKIDCTGLQSMECLMLKMQRENTRLVSAATGNSPSPCGRRTTLNDVFKEEVVQKNETVRKGVDTAGSTAKVGIVSGTVMKVTEKIVEGAGNKITLQNSDGAVVSDDDINREETVTGLSYQGDAKAELNGEGTVNSATETDEG